MAAAKALLAGHEPPANRPPCFFDPRHGPSTREVEWAPDGYQARPVPVCEADAVRLESGEAPMTREIQTAGGRVPIYDAPAYYGPYAGGFFGGFSGFLPGSSSDRCSAEGSEGSAAASAGPRTATPAASAAATSAGEAAWTSATSAGAATSAAETSAAETSENGTARPSRQVHEENALEAPDSLESLF
jgi:hypothetical protein